MQPRYLNMEVLRALDPVRFRETKPFPWINPENLLREEGYQRLAETVPDLDQFQKSVGMARKYGQDPHDRYELRYGSRLRLAEPWREFIEELKGADYRNFLCRMFNIRKFDFVLVWQYSFQGCSVSPHCDGESKFGSHIFYLNRPGEWNPSWGGETLILDDGGRFSPESNPDFSEFPQTIPVRSLGNSCLLFAKTRNSWHGVRKLSCPEGVFRKIFTVVIAKPVPVGQRVKAVIRRLVPKALLRRR